MTDPASCRAMPIPMSREGKRFCLSYLRTKKGCLYSCPFEHDLNKMPEETKEHKLYDKYVSFHFLCFCNFCDEPSSTSALLAGTTREAFSHSSRPFQAKVFSVHFSNMYKNFSCIFSFFLSYNRYVASEASSASTIQK